MRIYKRRDGLQDESCEWFLQREQEEGGNVSGTGFTRVNGKLVPQSFPMPLQRLGMIFAFAKGIVKIWFLAKILFAYPKSIVDKRSR